MAAMMLSLGFHFLFLLVYLGLSGNGALGNERQHPQQLLGFRKSDDKYKAACPDYRHYAAIPQ